jgi:hypothetical protein
MISASTSRCSVPFGQASGEAFRHMISNSEIRASSSAEGWTTTALSMSPGYPDVSGIIATLESTITSLIGTAPTRASSPCATRPRVSSMSLGLSNARGSTMLRALTPRFSASSWVTGSSARSVANGGCTRAITSCLAEVFTCVNVRATASRPITTSSSSSGEWRRCPRASSVSTSTAVRACATSSYRRATSASTASCGGVATSRSLLPVSLVIRPSSPSCGNALRTVPTERFVIPDTSDRVAGPVRSSAR